MALFAATGASEEARAADAYWGHCVQMGIGDPPSIFCECKSGPNQAGQYTCHSEGQSCAEKFPSMCGAA